MKNILKITALFLMILAIFNCSKNDDGGSPEQNVHLKTYGINANEYNITYSSEGRPTGFETSSGNKIIIYNDNNQIIQIGNATYTYNSQGRIATVNRINTPYVFAATISYNNTGQVGLINATFTTSGVVKTSTCTMEYEGSKLKTIKEYNTSINPNYYKLTLEYDTNNNIIQKIINSSNDDITYTNKQTNTYTYDTKTNPIYHTLNKTGITSQINMLYFIDFNDLRFSSYESLKYYNKNNILTSQTINFIGGSTFTNVYDYVYDENNFPISAERQSNNSTTGESTIYYNWTYETVN